MGKRRAKRTPNTPKHSRLDLEASPIIMARASTSKDNQGLASDWQSSIRYVGQSLLHICNTEIFADVHFIVGEGKQKQRIPAHRLILSIRSPVFAAMFSDNWSDTSREIEVPDVEAAVFVDLLKFMYHDYVAITADNVMSTLYTAKKYSLRALENQCVDFLTKNISATNAFTLLTQAKLFDELKLVESCLQIIDDQTLAAVQSEGFTNIDFNTLCSVLQRDSLTIYEFDLFQATLRWTKAECSRQKLPINANNELSVLKEGLYLIRFPLMTMAQFSSEEVADSGLLCSDDIASMMLYFARKKKPKICFSAVPRKIPDLVVSRFSGLLTNDILNGQEETVSFSVDRPVQLVGIGLYGSTQGPASYHVSCSLFNSHGHYSSKIFEEKFVGCNYDGSTKTFKVRFADPITLTANVIYDIMVVVKGPKSFHGSNGLKDVSIPLPDGEELKVTFSDISANDLSTFYTSRKYGQIPELLFRL